MYELWDYQRDVIDGTFANLEQVLDVLVVAPTGAGKTVLLSTTARTLIKEHSFETILVIAHRERLIEQIEEAFQVCGIKPIIVGSKHWQELWQQRVSNVLIGMVGTVAGRLGAIGRIDCLMVDESHHIIASTYQRIVDAASIVIGYTATPARLDGNGLGKEVGGPFDVMVEAPPIAELIKRKRLVPFVVYAPSPNGPNMSGVRMVAGDYNKADTRKIMETPARIRELVDGYQDHGDNQKAIAFCASRKHAHDTAAAFNAAGIPAKALVDVDKATEKVLYKELETGAIRVLTACDKLGEGVNVPDIGCVIMARPTASLTIYLQQIGRGLRTAPGKSRLIILDHAGNVSRHGFPDARREWVLNAVKRETAPQPVALKQCGFCAVLLPVQTVICPHCGHDHTVHQPTPITTARKLHQINPWVVKDWKITHSGNYFSKSLGATVYRNKHNKWGWKMDGASSYPTWYTTSTQAMAACEVDLGLEDAA